MLYSVVPHLTTPIYTPHLQMSFYTDEASRSVAETFDLPLIDLTSVFGKFIVR